MAWWDKPYSEDITFMMPLDTSGFDFTNFKILAISGLPFGLNWTCNNAANGCNYDPQDSQYGCMNVSGTAVQPGTYPLDVSLIATLNVIGDVPTNFYTQLIILPDTSSNGGFSMAGGFGCLPLTATFTNDNPGHAGYLWDFGNNTTSTLENPSPQIYSTPGEYVVTYEAFDALVPEYYLTEIQVLGVPNDWSWPGELNPDFYLELYDGNMNLISTTATVLDTDAPVTFPISNLLLANETYTVQVWDEDGGLLGADDDLGSTTFAGWSSSGSSTTGSTSISYTIAEVGPFPVVTSTDTVFVYGYPNTPNIDSTGLLLWSDSVDLSLQWYQNGNAVSGADSASYLATTSGEYFVVSTTPQGCSASSDTIEITICSTIFTPLITQNGNILYTDTSSYDFQWYMDGAPISGANSQLITADAEGDYWLELTAFNGCVYTSAIQVVDYTGLSEHELSDSQLSIYPNPSNGTFEVELNGIQGQELDLRIVDISGRIILKDKFIMQQSTLHKSIQLKVNPGVFFVVLSNEATKIQKRKIIK